MTVIEEPYFLPANHRTFLEPGESWIDSNQRFRQQQKYIFFRNAIDYLIDNDLSGSYFEFGIHRARTFTMAMSLDAFYAAQKGPTGGVLFPREGGGYFNRYVAFDSFSGFPPGTAVAEHPIFAPGALTTSEDEFLRLLEAYGQDTRRVELVTGFYEDSLTETLAQKFRARAEKASFVVIDCNLYDSYRVVLAWLDEFLQPGTVLYLDDFNSHRAQPTAGPKRAWNEYEKSSRWNFEPFLNVGWWGRAFVVSDDG
jgi:hypothetical protein